MDLYRGRVMALSLRILLADDESLNALALRAQLEALGHQVVGPAHNGRDAVELARTNEIDLAILDIQMPGISGVDAAVEISRERPVPIILLTGHSDPLDLEQASSAPIFHYLVKPVSLEDLGPAIAIARARFGEWSQRREPAEVEEEREEESVVIEEATKLVMRARGVSPDGAYDLLWRESKNRNEPIGSIARTILIAGNILRDSYS